jgi:hypothetical protein
MLKNILIGVVFGYLLMGLIIEIYVERSLFGLMNNAYVNFGQEQSVPSSGLVWKLILTSPKTYVRVLFWPLSLYQYQSIRNYEADRQY